MAIVLFTRVAYSLQIVTKFQYVHFTKQAQTIN